MLIGNTLGQRYSNGIHGKHRLPQKVPKGFARTSEIIFCE